jgi:hypothetical protein
MLGERNTLDRFTVRAKEEEDRWGTRGINTPRSRTVTVIFQISKPPRKILELQSLKSLLTVARTVGTSEKKLGTSEQGNNRGKNSSRYLPFGCGLVFKKDRL